MKVNGKLWTTWDTWLSFLLSAQHKLLGVNNLRNPPHAADGVFILLFLVIGWLGLNQEVLRMRTHRKHVRSELIDDSLTDMVACYGVISVIFPWLESLAAFVSVSPSSLTSTTSLVHSWVRWSICVRESLLCVVCVVSMCLCACAVDNIRVHWSVWILEVRWISLAFPQEHTSPPHILHSPVSCHEGRRVR